MYYDSRFFLHDDLFHRFYEFAILVVLATGVLYIRTVAVLSNTRDNIDLFTFSLSMLLSSILAIGRLVEIYFNVDGQPAAKGAAKRDIKWYLFQFSFYLAATILCAQDYYGSHDDYEANTAGYDDDHRRVLAAATDSSYGDYDSFENDKPIWVLIGASMATIIGAVVYVWILPGGGKHKE